MSGRSLVEPIFAAFRGEQRKATIILLVSPVLMVTWKYFGDPQFLARVLPDACVLWNDRGASGAIGSFVAAFTLLGLIPALIVRWVFHERLADYGVRIGDRWRTPQSILVLCPFFVLAAYVASFDPAVRKCYPINPSACSSSAMFAVHALSYLLFYLGWEFHFRGFLQFGLRQRLGDVNSLLIQVLASGLLHIGRPGSETYASFLAGLLWGVFAYRTRSLLSGLTQHYVLGISLDWFLCHL